MPKPAFSKKMLAFVIEGSFTLLAVGGAVVLLIFVIGFRSHDEYVLFLPLLAIISTASYLSIAFTLNSLLTNSENKTSSIIPRFALTILVGLALNITFGMIKVSAMQTGWAQFKISEDLAKEFSPFEKKRLSGYRSVANACNELSQLQLASKPHIRRSPLIWTALTGKTTYEIATPIGQLRHFQINTQYHEALSLSYKAEKGGTCAFEVPREFNNALAVEETLMTHALSLLAQERKAEAVSRLDNPEYSELSFFIFGYSNIRATLGLSGDEISPSNQSARTLSTILLWLNYIITIVVFAALGRKKNRTTSK